MRARRARANDAPAILAAVSEPPSPPRDAAWVRAYVEAGRAAWPDLKLDAALAEQHAIQRADDGDPLPLEHAADLYLACACAHGVQGAALALERRFSSDVDAALARVVREAVARDDAKQALRVKLLVAEGDALPRIASYAGRAPLKRWLAATALRLALNMRRNMADRPHDELPSTLGVAGAAAELAYVRTRYKAEFEDAVRAALRALSPRDATLLRLHLEERVGIDALGAMYRVGRSTAARWLQAARAALEDGVKKELHVRLRVTPAELESLAGELLSQLEVSVVGILREGSE